MKDPQAVPSFSSHPPPLSLPSTSLPRTDLENNKEISGGKRGTHVKREMWGILRESKLPEQKTEAERTASDRAADRPPKEGAERGWERRQRGPALDREARRAKRVWYWAKERILGHPQMLAKSGKWRTVRFERSG